jgi:hypothetical protein
LAAAALLCCRFATYPPEMGRSRLNEPIEPIEPMTLGDVRAIGGFV